MKVNTKQLWNILWKMEAQIARLEEMLEGLEWEELKEEESVCKERIEQEIRYERNLALALEKVVKNYEATERKLIKIQENGGNRDKIVLLERISLVSIKNMLQKWKLI